MTEAVREIILKPMLELYVPPRHLRNNDLAREQTITVYETALSRFDRLTLEKAWEQVVANRTDWTWPSPGLLVQACQRCQAHPVPLADEEQRRARAAELAKTYTSHFMKTSHVAKLAKAEGWAGFLRDYVHSAAWVQAQLICGLRQIGWDFCLVPNWDQHESAQNAFAAYRKTIAKPVERGQIRVTVPKDRIQDWKDRCPQGEHSIPLPIIIRR